MSTLTSDVADIELNEISGSGNTQAPCCGKAAKPAPPWLGPQKPASKPSRIPQPGTVDEDGHRVVLVDDEELTIVEGDLLLDIDQKDLWRETQSLRKADAENQLRFR